MVSFNRKLITSTAFALLSFFLSCSLVHANFFGEPNPKWSIQLRDSGRTSGRGLRKGNAIVSHKDGEKIVVTANDGSLHIIQTTNQVKTIGVYEPESKTGATTECTSAARIVYAEDQEGLYSFVQGGEEEEEKPLPRKEDFIVYAVIDKAGDSNDETTSRVIAVDMEGTFKWTINVSGKIEGAPAVGKSGIYVTSNQNGWATVLVFRFSPDESVVYTTTAGAYDAQLGPPSLRQPETWENEDDLEDVVVVAENWDSGFSQTRGGLYMLPLALSSSDVDEEDESALEIETSGRFDYKLTRISSWTYSASVPPLVHGDSIFLPASGGTLGGFTGNRRNDLSGITSGREEEILPRWQFSMSPNPLNASQPIQTQPAMGPDGRFMCVPGVANDIYCLQADNGRQLWRIEEGSEFLARPFVFEGERRTVVYAIETQNGRVHQYDLFSGRRYWDYSCADITNNLCQDAVEADFAITPGGNTLYYGDIYGRINCLGVADFETESPTVSPTATPTISPSVSPTLTAVPTEMPQEVQVENPDLIVIENVDQEEGAIILDGNDNGDDSGTTVASATVNQQQGSTWAGNNRTPLYIGAAIAGLCAIMIPMILFSMLRKKKKKLKSSKNLVVEMIDDCSSDDLEAQEFFNSIETNNTYDPNNGDGIEIEIINHATSPKGNPKKQKRIRGTPNAPATVNNSLDSIEETLENASAMVVLGKQYNVTDESVEAVNLRRTFDLADDSDDDIPPPPPVDENTPVSPSKEWTWGSLVQAGTSPTKKADNSSQIVLKKPSEKIELKQPVLSTSPSQEESSVSMSIASQKTEKSTQSKKGKRKKMRWGKKNKKNPSPESEKGSAEIEQVETSVGVSEVEESQAQTKEEPNEEIAPEQDVAEESSNVAKEEVAEEIQNVAEDEGVGEDQDDAEEEVAEEDDQEIEEPNTSTESSTLLLETPASPNYSMVSDAVESESPALSYQSSPVRSVQSIEESLFGTPNHSTTKSVGSDDDSLYTSYTGNTGMFGGSAEKKSKTKELSPYSSYVYDQDVRRRDRSEIVNERKSFLTQPVLSKSNARDDAEHPDDEIAAAPGGQYLAEHRHGTSARSTRGSNSFLSKNSGSESGHTTIAEMYDQLAAIGQQRREERKPAFRRRNKRMEREDATPAAQQQGGDTWGSFLNELAEAEKEFFSPSDSKSKSLLNDSRTEDIGELPRI